MAVNRKKSADAIVVPNLIGHEGLNNNNSNELRRCGRCKDSRIQRKLATVKEIGWNPKGMMERRVPSIVNRQAGMAYQI